MSRRALPWLALFAVACGGGSPDPGVDAGMADATDATPDAAEPAASAAPPNLGPCPTDWRQVPGDPPTCEPWPEGGRVRCGISEALFAGGCADILPCAAGDFADLADFAATDQRFVREGSDGDGSRGAPFGTIAQALTRATPATVVAVARGTYREDLVLPQGVTLVGACAHETTLRSEAAATGPFDAVVETRGDARLRGLGIQSSNLAGLLVRGTVEVEGLLVEGVVGSGIIVGNGGSLVGSSLVVRGTRPAGPFAVGLAVGPGGAADLSRVSVTENAGSGVSLLSASVTLTGAVIADNAGAAVFDPTLGRGVEVLDGATFRCVACVVEDNASISLFVENLGAQATFEDSLLRHLDPGVEDGAGRGLVGFEDTVVTLRRTRLVGFRQVALRAKGVGAQLVLEDVVVEGMPDGPTTGASLLLEAGAQATLDRVLIVRSGAAAAVINGAGTSAQVHDVTVRDTTGEPDGDFGIGVQVADGATLEGERLSIHRAHMTGLIAGGVGLAPRVVLADLIVDGTAPRLCAETGGCAEGHGDGVVATELGLIELTRFVVSGSNRAGVHVAGGDMLLVEGLVRDNVIGAAVQTPGFDLARINDGVTYRDNTRRLDTSSLPVEVPDFEF